MMNDYNSHTLHYYTENYAPSLDQTFIQFLQPQLNFKDTVDIQEFIVMSVELYSAALSIQIVEIYFENQTNKKYLLKS